MTFRLDEPTAEWVVVVGSFTDWVKHPIHLIRDAVGVWTAAVPLPPGRYEYRFLVDGAWRDDPACPDRVPNGFGCANCVLTVAAPEAPYCRAESTARRDAGQAAAR